MFKVGDEVVLFYAGRPCQHNSVNSPLHPCRGKILKVGRKNYHVETIGSPWQVPIDGKGVVTVHTVEEARQLHRKNFEGPDEWRIAEFIENVINGL